ncbi:MAG: 2-C-methyl-D-erythritol 4-phosphate cytidylyltransferase [Calditerrivibrio sp.]|nr:2-C-methyl-D-erythritol 4-phosphate cytidylyltransferase [Calditerrivibrio sp.]MCA1932108.1 2-C-methyl-D-erythritol 4-phosphate cytidylyltransferase [Calditerrivibrio sp.]
MSISVIVPAGGVGKRFSSTTKKQFYKIGDYEVIFYTLLRLKAANPALFIIGCDDSDQNLIADIMSKLSISSYIFATAGKERQHTVMNCLNYASSDYVLIHDAARPFLSKKILDRMLQNYENYDGLICGIKPKDTVKKYNDENIVEKTIDRNALILVHTPQIFKRKILVNCLSEVINKNINITDDAMALEYFNYEVGFVDSEWYNIKITTQDDIFLSEYIINNFDTIAGG